MRSPFAGFRRFLMGGAVVALAAGCSVADYEKPIGDLSAAVETSITAVTALDQHMTEVQNERWRKGIVAGTVLLTTEDDACAIGTPGCALEVEMTDGSTHVFPATSLMPKGRIGLQELKTYVANLKAIVDADTVEQIDKSTDETLGSLESLEAAIAKATGAPDTGRIARFQAPVAAAVNWLAGQYVDGVKFQALAHATREAQPVIDKLADLYATAASAVVAYQVGDATKTFVDKQTQFDDGAQGGRPTPALIDEYVQAAAAYDVVLKASAAMPLAEFAETHRMLEQQLNGDGKITLAATLAAIQDLKQRALAFKAVVDGFKQAVADEGRP